MEKTKDLVLGVWWECKAPYVKIAGGSSMFSDLYAIQQWKK